jgi:hypothetical protein
LRAELHRILRHLDRAVAARSDAAFLHDFLERRFFFVHAVKCWTAARYPGFGRGARRGDREATGLPLLRMCAREHLEQELIDLAPRRVSALGELPYLALCELFPELDPRARPTQGRVFDVSAARPWRLLYTCFPSPANVAGVALRDRAQQHLERFLDDLPPR